MTEHTLRLPEEKFGLQGISEMNRSLLIAKLLLIGGIAYGLGVVGLASVRAAELWDTSELFVLLSTVVLDGLLWPLYLYDMIA